jgi:hypothetical protein
LLFGIDVYFPENQVFQFFVRAQDRGSPPLHSNVPVDVYVMGAQDVAPMFERKDDKFFFSENSPPGWLCKLLLMLVFWVVTPCGLVYRY